MADSSRIPRRINPFNQFINSTAPYLKDGSPATNAERLGISTDEVTTYTGFQTEWNTLYISYSDKQNSRTTSVINRLHDVMNRLIAFDQQVHLLDRIAASVNATIVDLSTFNIRKGPLQKSARTLPQKPIVEPVTVTMMPIGGGSVMIKCYSTTGTRSAIFGDADCVQYVFAVGTTPPESAETAGLERDLSSKASFTLALGPGNVAKNLYIYFRWYNTRHPELAGPWSNLNNTLLL